MGLNRADLGIDTNPHPVPLPVPVRLCVIYVSIRQIIICIIDASLYIVFIARQQLYLVFSVLSVPILATVPRSKPAFYLSLD